MKRLIIFAFWASLTGRAPAASVEDPASAPKPQQRVQDKLVKTRGHYPKEIRKLVLQDNAQRLYNLPF